MACTRRAPVGPSWVAGYGRLPLDATTDALTEALARLQPRSDAEAAALTQVVELAQAGDPWSRATALHVTCSALVVHPGSGRVLLRWHQRQQAWIQVGGHADPGESDPFAIAVREAVEETGLRDLVAWPAPDPATMPPPLHLAIVPVPANEHEPAHHHADLRYALATTQPDAIVPESPGAPLRWVSVAEAHELTREDNVRETLARVVELLHRTGPRA
jgi:8-oxo-dGTP pyrophosphatase MutT (NUDIX family)